MKMQRDKIYRSRCGELWRVVCIDAMSDVYPVIAIPYKKDFLEDPIVLTIEGHCYEPSAFEPMPNDLVSEVREIRRLTRKKLGGTQDATRLPH